MTKLSISSCFHFRKQWVFPRYLTKFKSVTNIRTRGFWNLNSENLRLQLTLLLSSLEKLRKRFFFSKVSAAWVQIKITINVKNCTNKMSRSFILYANRCTDGYQNFNPSGILEKTTSLSPILAKTWNKEK